MRFAASPTLALGRDFGDIRDAVTKLCHKFPGSYWRQMDREKCYPEAFVAALQSGGFLRALIPERFGGEELPLRAASVILEEIHAAGCNAGAAHAQIYQTALLNRHASENVKQNLLPRLASGAERLQAFGVTEPSTGSDTLSIKTRARLAGDHYILNGQKVWTSRVEHSDWMTVLARTSSSTPDDRKEGLTLFLVNLKEAIAEGTVDIRKIDAMINHQSCEVFLNDTRVPKERIIGQVGHGFQCLLAGLNAERILLASEALGDARYFLDKAVSYANSREVFGRSIGSNQGVQFPLAEARIKIEASDLLIRSAAAQFENGDEQGFSAGAAKYQASETSWFAAEACFQTYGGFAFAREYDIERKWRETRLFRTAPISNNMVLSNIAISMGLQKSY